MSSRPSASPLDAAVSTSLRLSSEHSVAESLAEADFKAVFRNHAAGVAVVTADSPDGPVAITATSVSSLSAAPPLFLFSLSAHSSTAPAITRAETVVVHILEDTHAELARLCSTSGVDRFAGPASWTRLATGEPLFSGVNTWVRGAIVNQMSLDGSTVIAVRALEASSPANPETSHPLVYHNRVWHALGEHTRLPDW